MTTWEIYIMGYIYGYVTSIIDYTDEEDKSGNRLSKASRNPAQGFADIMTRLRRTKRLTEGVNNKITLLSNEVESINEDMITTIEQGHWQIGYHHARNGKSPEFNGRTLTLD